LSGALAAFEALAVPDERSGVGIPADNGVVEPGDQVILGLRMVALEGPPDEDPLDGLTEPTMVHVLSLVLQRVTISARVPVACSGSLPPDSGVRLGMHSPD